jgi:hypothetical protein
MVSISIDKFLQISPEYQKFLQITPKYHKFLQVSPKNITNSKFHKKNVPPDLPGRCPRSLPGAAARCRLLERCCPPLLDRPPLLAGPPPPGRFPARRPAAFPPAARPLSCLPPAVAYRAVATARPLARTRASPPLEAVSRARGTGQTGSFSFFSGGMD